MKTKKRQILVYAAGTGRVYGEFVVHVDQRGGEWLSPEQIEALEAMHAAIQGRRDSNLTMAARELGRGTTEDTPIWRSDTALVGASASASAA